MIPDDIYTAITEAEQALLAFPNLTRIRVNPTLTEPVRVIFDLDGVTVSTMCRGVKAKGRGSKLMSEVSGWGQDLTTALNDFRDSLAVWDHVLNQPFTK